MKIGEYEGLIEVERRKIDLIREQEAAFDEVRRNITIIGEGQWR